MTEWQDLELDEIADWLEMTNEEKQQVLNQLEERRKAAA